MAGNEGRRRTQSVSQSAAEVENLWNLGCRGRSLVSLGLSPSSPLPNYYLVIFLSECSVNALRRNAAKRSGWMMALTAHHCNRTSSHETRQRDSVLCRVLWHRGNGRRRGGSGRGHLSSHLAHTKKKTSTTVALLLLGARLVRGNQGTADKT